MFSLSPLNVYAADWELIGYSPDFETHIYLDFDSIVVNENFRTFTGMQDFPNKKNSRKTRLIIDCDKQMIKWLELTSYDMNMGLGNPKKENIISDWQKYSSNSPYGGFDDILCRSGWVEKFP